VGDLELRECIEKKYERVEKVRMREDSMATRRGNEVLKLGKESVEAARSVNGRQAREEGRNAPTIT